MHINIISLVLTYIKRALPFFLKFALRQLEVNDLDKKNIFICAFI